MSLEAELERLVARRATYDPTGATLTASHLDELATCPECARYRTIVADPPWPFRWSGSAGGAHRNPTPMAYRLMSLDEIKALPVATWPPTTRTCSCG
jgi:hypothetical protein